MIEEPTIEQMIADLLALGWKRWGGMSTVWESPNKALWRGPYKARTVATGRAIRKPE